MARSPRSEAEIARTRGAILDAAARAFARRGFGGITMEELAGEAGYSTASLYNYFPNKEAVLRALIDRSLQQMMQAVEGPIPRGLDPGQRVELVLLRLLEAARSDLWLMALMMAPEVAGSDSPGPDSLK